MMITAQQALQLVNEDKAQLVDVRDPHEFRTGAAPGAVNIPLSILPLKTGELDNTRPVILYCAAGGRSAQAAMLLQRLGFDKVFNAGSVNSFLRH